MRIYFCSWFIWNERYQCVPFKVLHGGVVTRGSVQRRMTGMYVISFSAVTSRELELDFAWFGQEPVRHPQCLQGLSDSVMSHSLL